MPAVSKGVVLAGIAFFAFELYTFTDAASTHLFPSQISSGFPAPYDMYSAGMIFMLLAIAVSKSLRDVCLKPAAMASGATLMAVSPLYAVLDSMFPATFLAQLGGVGKAVVFIQVGRMLGLVGPLRPLFIVTGSIVLAKGGFGSFPYECRRIHRPGVRGGRLRGDMHRLCESIRVPALRGRLAVLRGGRCSEVSDSSRSGCGGYRDASISPRSASCGQIDGSL